MRVQLFLFVTCCILFNLSIGWSNENTIAKIGDGKQSKKDALSYFMSMNNEASITILPGDVANLSFITTNDFITDDVNFSNTDLTFITQNIYFNYNSEVIPTLGIDQLESLAVFLHENPKVKVNISCYTDSRGNANYNKLLSEKRSDNIRLYILSKGITGERVITSGFGENNPIVDCEKIACDDEKHAKNRRAELKIIWN